jgi:hypothetical protein
MSDNVPLPAAADRAASDKVTYSGDTDAHVQLLRSVLVTGAEDSKTVLDPFSQSATTMQNAAAATGNGTSLDLYGKATAILEITGSFSAAVTFEASVDGGSTWHVVNYSVLAGTGLPGITPTTTTGLFAIPCAGIGLLRARISSYSTGNVTVKGYTSAHPFPIVGPYITVQGGSVFTAGSTSHDSAAATSSPVLVGGYSSTAAPSAVSNDTDATRLWLTPNGAVACQLVSSGVLIDPRVGNVAHDDANSGNPVLIGVEAIAIGSNPTEVAAADRTKLYANRAGVLYVIGGHMNVQSVRLQFTAAQTDTAIISVSAGTKIVVTSIQVTLDNASTVFPSVRVGFGASTTPTTTAFLAHGGLPAGGGTNRGDGSGIVAQGADGEDLRITTVGAATGNGVEVVVSYFTLPS